MPELSALRARLKDRQVKDGALGTVETTVCLDLGLIEELVALENERDDLTSWSDGAKTLAGEAIQDTTEVDAKIAAKKAEIEESSLTLVFRAISSVRYQEIMNQFEDPDESRTAFMADLCSACLYEVWSDGEKVGGEGVEGGLKWDEIYREMSFGEWDTTSALVFGLNRRKMDAPFSLKHSRRTRNSAETLKSA